MSTNSWKILTTLSGKGGVGKTTIASSLGYSFAQMGFKTLIIDLDVGLRNLDLQFQLQSEIVFDLEHVLKGIIPLEQALIQPSYAENLNILTSSLSRDIESIPVESFHRFLKNARENFEIIIIDAPAGVDSYMLKLISPTEKILLVSQPHQASMRSIDKLLGLLNKHDTNDIHWVINRFHPQVHDQYLIKQLEDQINFKSTFVMDDLDEVTISSSKNQYIDRMHTPIIVNKSIELAQILLAKKEKQSRVSKNVKNSSWWPSWLSWSSTKDYSS